MPCAYGAQVQGRNLGARPARQDAQRLSSTLYTSHPKTAMMAVRVAAYNYDLCGHHSPPSPRVIDCAVPFSEVVSRCHSLCDEVKVCDEHELAFAMATHTRLGAKAGLIMHFPGELVKIVMESCGGWRAELTAATLSRVGAGAAGPGWQGGQLIDIPMGLRARTDLRELKVRSMLLPALPTWLGDLSLETLDVSGHAPRICAGPANSMLQELQLPSWALGKLRRLRLDGFCCLETLPEAVGDLSRLEILQITGCNKLKKLPKRIGSLFALRTLKLAGLKALEEMPDTIGELKSLQKLTVWECSLRRLPASLGMLSALEKLELGEHRLRGLPAEFENLKSLKELYILQSTRKWMHQMLIKLKRLAALKHLSLETRDGGIEELPECLFQLTTLESLAVSEGGGSSSLTLIPASIRQLRALRQLTLYGLDRVVELPAEIAELALLDTLIIVKCSSLTALPSALEALIGLQELRLSWCDNLQQLPTLGAFRALKRLTLKGLHKIQELPESIGECLLLQEIDIVDCSLDKLPPSMGSMRSLKKLRLIDLYGLARLPEGIGDLESLETLEICMADVDGDEYLSFEELPPSIGALSSLTHLKLSDSQEIEQLPNAIGDLASLKTLELLECPLLMELPPSIGALSSLTHLKLSGSEEIEQLPDTIGDLVSLKTIELSCCPLLSALPPRIGSLMSLQHLSVQACGLKDLPPIEGLTALRKLTIEVCEYTKDCKVFVSLACSLPCLKQLQTLHVNLSKKDHLHEHLRDSDETDREGMAIAIARSLKAWPLPLLLDFAVGREFEGGIVNQFPVLCRCWQALGLPADAATWDMSTALECFRQQQQNALIFASGLHPRLGAASHVAWLDEQALMMIVDELLGGWSLLQLWQHNAYAYACTSAAYA